MLVMCDCHRAWPCENTLHDMFVAICGGSGVKRFVERADRGESTLFPECRGDWIDEDNSVRVIDVFVDELDLNELDFCGVDPKETGRPSYRPSILLKIYIYGYLNQVQSSSRLGREVGRNVEVMWLTVHLLLPARHDCAPGPLRDSKIARTGKMNGPEPHWEKLQTPWRQPPVFTRPRPVRDRTRLG
jgi:hypothetical protein